MIPTDEWRGYGRSRGRPQRRAIPDVSEIVEAVVAKTGVAMWAIRSRQRMRHVVAARHELFRRLRDAGLTSREIAEVTGCGWGAVRMAWRKAK